jgi:hypothetical protein
VTVFFLPDPTRAISMAVRPYSMPVIAAVQGCSWIMDRGRDEDPKGIMSVSAITLPIKSFKAV